jgi:putative acetyltransferase
MSLVEHIEIGARMSDEVAEPWRVEIRPEAQEDWAAVEAVTCAAFRQDAEATLVAKLRSCPDVLSLVAIAEGAVVGHVMFSPVTLPGVDAAPVIRGLAPVAVLPELQCHGIGTRLIAAGLDELRRKGIEVVVVLGHSTYYPRFGFRPGSAVGVRCKWGEDTDSFQVLELVPGAAGRCRGMVEYLPVFDDIP